MSRTDPAHLFTLRVKEHDGGTITIRAFEGNPFHYTSGHTRIDVEVRQSLKGRKGTDVVFPRGQLYCGIPAGKSIDGTYARDCVLDLVAMKPGDTDADYFDGYTEGQRDFAERFGDLLTCERYSRGYCDEDGNCK